MHNLSLTELSAALDNRSVSSKELTEHFLSRINKYATDLNCFITITQEQALKAAEQADQQRAAGQRHPLLGIPYAQKDIFCTKGIKTSCGSKMLDNFISPYDATVVEKCQQAGMVMLGKTNLDEFAMGSSNENSYYGAVKNPWDLQRVPGGSSGGSACAVASGLVPFATGTDTGGSIRQPAALCGISGIKPTYGRVSRYGMVAFASSMDQGGPFARSAQDLALVLQTMAGFDARDSTCVNKPVPDYTQTLQDKIAGLKIGIPKEFFSQDLNQHVAISIENAIKELTNLGAIICDISLPNTPLGIAAYYVVAPAECSSNLSRYDGVRYGYRCGSPENLLDLYCRSRGEGFGEEVKRRIMVGTYALSSGYYDAYYLKAQKVRRLIQNDYINAFRDVDIIAGPTSPNTAFAIGDKIDDPVTMYQNDIFTLNVNLAGLPAISIPAGFHQSLPIGLQLIGNYFDEAKLLNVAHQYQQVTDWHQKIPAAYVE